MIYKFLYLTFISLIINNSYAASHSLQKLALAYPHHISQVTSNYIAWKDGTRMQIESKSFLANQLAYLRYGLDRTFGTITIKSIEREHYDALFKKMYGHDPATVKKSLVTIYWMPKLFGTRYPIRVTRINGIHQKLARISAELEKLPVTYHKYLINPAGGYYWRKVRGESYLSTHSFGIAIDINSEQTNYWLWDCMRAKKPLSQLKKRYHIPKRIVQIFEKEGFFWGGHWYFYDTMHFEYRPDLF